MTDAFPDGLGIGPMTAATSGVCCRRCDERVERARVGALRVLGGEHQRTVEPGAEALGHEVVGLAGGVGLRVGAGVGEREAHRQQGDRQQQEEHESTDRRGPRTPLDDAAPPVPHRLLTRLRFLAAPHREAIDGATDEPEQGREKGDRRQHHDGDGHRGADGHAVHEVDAHEEQAHERDHDRAPGEHDGATGRVDRPHHRVLGLEAFVETLAVARDDEQRVVDAHADADHRRELGGEVGRRDDVAEQLHQTEADADAEQRDEDRQAHGEQRTERHQQDDDGGEDPDELRRSETSGLLEHAPTERDPHATTGRVVRERPDVLNGGVGDLRRLLGRTGRWRTRCHHYGRPGRLHRPSTGSRPR